MPGTHRLRLRIHRPIVRYTLLHHFHITHFHRSRMRNGTIFIFFHFSSGSSLAVDAATTMCVSECECKCNNNFILSPITCDNNARFHGVDYTFRAPPVWILFGASRRNNMHTGTDRKYTSNVTAITLDFLETGSSVQAKCSCLSHENKCSKMNILLYVHFVVVVAVAFLGSFPFDVMAWLGATTSFSVYGKLKCNFHGFKGDQRHCRRRRRR